MSNQKILFISHAEKDSMIVEKFVDLLFDMGVPEESMFCSSISEIGVPIKVDIYEYLRNLLDSEEVIPIFMLSDQYYASAACLNEMGAVWVKQKDYFTFLLPGFKFSKIKGAINPSKRGISLGYQSQRELQNLKGDLNQFQQEISRLFSLKQHRFWERKRDEFISQLHNPKSNCDDIDLTNCEGFCIGEYTHKGCTVTFDRTRDTLCADIDFDQTKAEICSVVIFTGERDMRNQYEADRELLFELKASDTISSIDVECRLKNRDVRRTILVSSDWSHYRIPLSKLGGGISEWESLKEVKFLLRRENTSGGCIEIRNLAIE